MIKLLKEPMKMTILVDIKRITAKAVMVMAFQVRD